VGRLTNGSQPLPVAKGHPFGRFGPVDHRVMKIGDCQNRLRAVLKAGSSFASYIEEQRAVIGDDPFPLGLAAMGRNIERAIQGSVEQGLLRRPLSLADIYYRATLLT
jgi:hypothetical protein